MMPLSIFSVNILSENLLLLLQGGSLGWMAKKLGVSYDQDPEVETFGMEVPKEMGDMRDHVVTADDIANGKTLRELHLPHGSMQLQEGDHLLIIMGESDDD